MSIDLDKIEEAATSWKVCIADDRRSACRHEAEELWGLLSTDKVLALTAIARAAQEYKREFENPAPDYSHRAFLRQKLFKSLTGE